MRNLWQEGMYLYIVLRVSVEYFLDVIQSVAVIIAFLIRKLNFTFKTALAHVQSRRPIANPNYGFIEQLKIYETKLE